MKKYISIPLLIILALSISAGCKKDKGNPPELPPVESMLIDFRNFEISKKSDLTVNTEKGVEDSNWEFAALVAGYWRSILVTTLAVPVATFERASSNNPVYMEANTWQWNYDATVTINQVSVTYKARLTGQVTATSVVWKMYISKTGTGAFNEFIWFEGTSAPDGSGGKWTINYNSQFPEPVIEIDWTRSSSTVATVKYTYVRILNNNRAPDQFRDSFIEYGLTNSSLNAFYTIHYYSGLLDASENRIFYDVNVEWNTTSNDGRVSSYSRFGNTNWYCWDSNRVNVICP